MTLLLVSDFECFMFIFLLLSSFIYFIFRVLTVLMWSVESRWCWRDQEVYDWRRLTTFTKLIGSKEDIVQVNSIDNLLGMCFKDEQKREVFVRQGGIQELVSVLSDPNLLSSSKSKETALRESITYVSGRPVVWMHWWVASSSILCCIF